MPHKSSMVVLHRHDERKRQVFLSHLSQVYMLQSSSFPSNHSSPSSTTGPHNANRYCPARYGTSCYIASRHVALCLGAAHILKDVHKENKLCVQKPVAFFEVTIVHLRSARLGIHVVRREQGRSLSSAVHCHIVVVVVVLYYYCRRWKCSPPFISLTKEPNPKNSMAPSRYYLWSRLWDLGLCNLAPKSRNANPQRNVEDSTHKKVLAPSPD